MDGVRLIFIGSVMIRSKHSFYLKLQLIKYAVALQRLPGVQMEAMFKRNSASYFQLMKSVFIR